MKYLLWHNPYTNRPYLFREEAEGKLLAELHFVNGSWRRVEKPDFLYGEGYRGLYWQIMDQSKVIPAEELPFALFEGMHA